METQNNLLENLSTDVRDYLRLRYDAAKLRGVEGLSVFFGRVMAFAVVCFMGLAALLFGGFALAYLLGQELESDAAGFAIVGGGFLIIALLVYALRKRFFVNTLVRFFVPLFFDEKKD